MIHVSGSVEFLDCKKTATEFPAILAYARDGCGTSLCFHRPVGSGVYEADVWLTLLYLPIFPLATWVVHPRRMRSELRAGHRFEVYELEFLGERKSTLADFLRMYARAMARMLVAFGPLVATYVFVLCTPKGKADELKMALFGSSLVWALAKCLRWAYQRDDIYKTAESWGRDENDMQPLHPSPAKGPAGPPS